MNLRMICSNQSNSVTPHEKNSEYISFRVASEFSAKQDKCIDIDEIVKIGTLQKLGIKQER